MTRRTKLTAAEKRKLKVQLERATSAVDSRDAEYVLDKAPEVLEKLEKSPTQWLQELAQRARLLHWLIVDWWNGDYKPSWRVVAIAVSALLYLINPFDLIPDFIPVIGLVDDAAMLVLACRMIEEELQRYARKMKIDPEEFDLVLT